jgi:CRISPR-associated protein Csx17
LAQKKSPASGKPFALWAAEAQEDVLEVFAAHVVPSASGRSFNPVLGKAGKIGQRDFAKGWKRAVEALAQAQHQTRGSSSRRGKTLTTEACGAPDRKQELAALLRGEPMRWLLDGLNAGSWFSNALKLYNTGQRPNREEPISPWLLALACEGVAFLSGGASRRFGAQAARATGAFPFATVAAAPQAAGEAGRDSGEFWAPIWGRLMTLAEVRALFSRGRAEVRGRGVLTPSAFATAIVARGVDAGIDEFRRFVLGWTTAQEYIEPRFEGTFCLPTAPDGLTSARVAEASTALERVLSLVDRLPQDRKVGQRWRFVGLRGPIESAMLRLAAAPDNPEVACSLLDAVVASLDRVDRNRSFRERRIWWEPLPAEWVPSLFGDHPPEVEARLALALLSSFPVSRPFAVYRFGVEMKGGRFEHPERPPARWTFRPGPLPRALSAVLRRRTLDWESASRQQNAHEEPVRSVMPARCSDVGRWLDGAVDEALLVRWIDRLALFDWRSVPDEVRRLAPSGGDGEPAAVTGALGLYGLFHPLFDLRRLWDPGAEGNGDLLGPETGARTPGAARALSTLVGAAQLGDAVRLAASRYAMAGAPLAQTDVPWGVEDPDRLLAAMLLPITGHERTVLITRWIRPRRQKGEKAWLSRRKWERLMGRSAAP